MTVLCSHRYFKSYGFDGVATDTIEYDCELPAGHRGPHEYVNSLGDRICWNDEGELVVP